MMEKRDVTGLSIDDKINKIEISEIQEYHSFFKIILEILKRNNIKFGMFMQCDQSKMSFTINEVDAHILNKELEKAKEKQSFKYTINNDIDCLTLVGLGFVSSPILSISIYQELNNEKININQSMVSNLSLSILIDKKDSKQAVNAITNKFDI